MFGTGSLWCSGTKCHHGIKSNSTDQGEGCASQAGPACLVEEWGRGLPREHRLVPGMTLMDRCSINKTIVEPTFHSFIQPPGRFPWSRFFLNHGML